MVTDGSRSLELRRIQAEPELITDLLGVRRAGVSLTAGNLQKKGLIRYVHGKITIVDRERLEELACKCDRISREDFLEIGD